MSQLGPHDVIPDARDAETREACPIPRAHQRLSHAHRIWHLLLDAYQRPDDFLLLLNAAVEAYRNVTFILQTEMAVLPESQAWYQAWRDRMQDAAAMTWLHDARTHVVHRGDLETDSTATVRVHKDWFGPQATPEFSVSPFIEQPELAVAIARRLDLSQLQERTGIIEVERRWVENKLRDFEVLYVLASCYGYLHTILWHAHARVGIEMGEVFGDPHPATPRPDFGYRPACMTTDRAARTAYVDISTLHRVGATVSPAALDEMKPDAAAQMRALWPLATGHVVETHDKAPEIRDAAFVRQADLVFEAAKKRLVLDRYVVTTAFIYSPETPCLRYVFHDPGPEAMYLAFRDIAAHMKRLEADQLLFLSELWLAGPELKAGELPSDLPTRREALGCIALTARGPQSSLQRVAVYSRDEGEVPQIEEELSNAGEVLFQFLVPIITMWAGVGPDDRVWPTAEPGTGQTDSPLPLNSVSKSGRPPPE